MNPQKIRARGFTLIELLIVIAIIALLAGIVGVSLSASRAKANDTKTVTTASSYRASFSAAANGAPNPGDDTNYYCAGKTASETCSFWGQTLQGNDAIKSVVHDYIGGSSGVVPTVTISGMDFNAVAYKCKSVATGACEAAIYWAQSPQTSCVGGIQIYENSNGRVCSSDADAYSSNNVESAPANFLSAAGSPSDDEEFSGPTFSVPSTITIAQGVVAMETNGQRCFVVNSTGVQGLQNTPYAEFKVGMGPNGCDGGAGAGTRVLTIQPLTPPGRCYDYNGIVVKLTAASGGQYTFNLTACN